ncbi:MAG TPA: YebC/PmpR family DNA-binding transcriptional regulator [Patescibacteria group bacterium]|nr:YebC/PmpR family DNA-binding transcriptional regulator [Patescibacteria group bacterium]
MSGHSHFATIKRQKAVNDAAKGNLFSKLARSVMIAAKGGADPDMNFKLRVEIDKARAASMPKENIDRAIAKATTEAANLIEITYEGFGPGGISVIVDVATDNKNRSAQEIKNIFERVGGTMAGPGAVSYNFENKGFILVKKSEDPESQMLQMIDLGVEDVTETADGIEVYTAPDKLSEERKKFESAGFTITETELIMKPKNMQTVEDLPLAKKALAFLDSVEEYDDVVKVFSNLNISDEISEQLSNE